MTFLIGGSSGAGKEIGYDQISAGTIIVNSTVEATPTTIIACAAHVFDGSPVILEVYIPGWFCFTVSITGTLGLYEGATEITQLGQSFPAANQMDYPVTMRYRFTPSAGSHTYTIAGFVSAAGNIQMNNGAGGVGALPPAYARFTKV